MIKIIKKDVDKLLIVLNLGKETFKDQTNAYLCSVLYNRIKKEMEKDGQ